MGSSIYEVVSHTNTSKLDIQNSFVMIKLYRRNFFFNLRFPEQIRFLVYDLLGYNNTECKKWYQHIREMHRLHLQDKRSST